MKPIHIQKYYDHLFEKGLTGNTVLHYHANIRKALDSAMKLDVIPSNPADKIERPKKNQYIADYYSLDNLIHYLLNLKETLWKLLFYLLVFMD